MRSSSFKTPLFLFGGTDAAFSYREAPIESEFIDDGVPLLSIPLFIGTAGRPAVKLSAETTCLSIVAREVSVTHIYSTSRKILYLFRASA